MKSVTIWFLAFSLSANALELKTKSGKLFHNAIVARVMPDSISFIHDSGAATIPNSDLPDEIIEAYAAESARAAVEISNPKPSAAANDNPSKSDNQQKPAPTPEGKSIWIRPWNTFAKGWIVGLGEKTSDGGGRFRLSDKLIYVEGLVVPDPKKLRGNSPFLTVNAFQKGDFIYRPVGEKGRIMEHWVFIAPKPIEKAHATTKKAEPPPPTPQLPKQLELLKPEDPKRQDQIAAARKSPPYNVKILRELQDGCIVDVLKPDPSEANKFKESGDYTYFQGLIGKTGSFTAARAFRDGEFTYLTLKGSNRTVQRWRCIEGTRVALTSTFDIEVTEVLTSGVFASAVEVGKTENDKIGNMYLIDCRAEKGAKVRVKLYPDGLFQYGKFANTDSFQLHTIWHISD